MTAQTYHRTADVKGRKIFYRDWRSGCAHDPAAARLADSFHLIAPDHVGFGHSDAPLRGEFTYTFDNLADHVSGLVDVLRLAVKSHRITTPFRAQ